jgi:predicted transposase/invertase (TIGR01784 family)
VGRGFIGNRSNDIPNIILLWVTDFIVYPDIEPYLSEHTIVRLPKGNDPMKIGTRKSRTFILELPKIIYSVENLSNIEKDLLQLWMTFIKKPEIISENTTGQPSEIGEAMAELRRLSSDRTARALYEAELRAENDRIADNASAQRGISEGMEKGKMEDKLETALSMLMEGLPSSLVARCTGLTIDEIRKLENQLKKA